MYEIEIKSLIGEKVYADILRKKLLSNGALLTNKNSQLNHYFQGNPSNFFEKIKDIATDELENLEKILALGKKHSIRTRKKDNDVILVVKSSIDDGTSENTVSRMEYESTVPVSLEELDDYLLEAGLSYQAKWSRDREEYSYNDLTITLDRNAGYGWLSEFEKVVTDDMEADDTRSKILETMSHFDLYELPQDRLERMFEYYNKNWNDYYGTEKVFVVK